jgi:hypothetical protein
VLNDLIVQNAPALVRHWVRCRLGDLHLRLYPTPQHNAADFAFLLAMRRRHIASIRLTRMLADHLVGDPLEQTCPRQRQMWTSAYERMMPLVFGVGFFLDEHRRLLLERDLGRIRPRSHIGYNVCTTSGITDQEMMIMKKLDPPMRLQYFYMYCFILQVLMRKLRPSSRTGPASQLVPKTLPSSSFWEVLAKSPSYSPVRRTMSDAAICMLSELTCRHIPASVGEGIGETLV